MAHYPSNGHWLWDNEGDPHPVGLTAWWRWWLVCFAVGGNAFTTAGDNWGAGVLWGNTTESWGLACTTTYISGLRAIVEQWKPGHSWCRWIIISFDATLFDPSQTADDVHNPNNDFGHWGKISGNSYVPARFANARYCDGTV